MFIFCMILGISLMFFVGSISVFLKNGGEKFGNICVMVSLATIFAVFTITVGHKMDRDGSPIELAEQGIYKVGFIYVTDRVSVGIEKPDAYGQDRLYLVQFNPADVINLGNLKELPTSKTEIYKNLNKYKYLEVRIVDRVNKYLFK